MKTHLSAAALIVGLTLGGTAMAADPINPSGTSQSSTPSHGTTGAQQQGIATPSNTAPSGTQDLGNVVGAKVVDPAGKSLGTVKELQADASGSADQQLVVGLNDGKEVLLPASKIKVASNDTVKTTLSSKQVKALPEASRPSTSGQYDTGATMQRSPSGANDGMAPQGSGSIPPQ